MSSSGKPSSTFVLLIIMLALSRSFHFGSFSKAPFARRASSLFVSGGAATASTHHTGLEMAEIHEKYDKIHSTKIEEYDIEAVLYR